jgi:hypothetical protein
MGGATTTTWAGVVVLIALAVGATSVLAADPPDSSPLGAPASSAASLHPSISNTCSTVVSSTVVRVEFQSCLPRVEILPWANASWGVVLQLDNLLEIRESPTSMGHPAVVSVAAPELLQGGFNGTIGHYGGRDWVGLVAALPVQVVNGSLWNGSQAFTSIGSSSYPGGSYAVLAVNYSLVNGTDGSQGVLLSWTVSGWHWTNALSDQLAIEYELDFTPGARFEACPAAPTLTGSVASCSGGRVLGVGAEVWDSNLSTFRAVEPSGAVASVGWGSSIHAAGTSVPVTAAAFVPAANSGHLVLAANAGGASYVSGSTTFLFSLPPAVAHVAQLFVQPIPYGIALAVSVASAAGAIVAYRRHERNVLEQL